jgi:hypothetical protein
VNLITYIELKIGVDYDFRPSEKATNTYPGCESSVELNAVFAGGIDILNSLTESEREELIQKCFDTEESKLLTETHLPDLDDNLAKLSITL